MKLTLLIITSWDLESTEFEPRASFNTNKHFDTGGDHSIREPIEKCQPQKTSYIFFFPTQVLSYNPIVKYL